MKILVVRLSSIGDIVLCTPVIRALKQQLNAEVHFLVKKSFAGVLDGNPNITLTRIYEEEVKTDFVGLQAEDFDVVFDLHKNLRTLRVRRRLKARNITFDKLNWQKWLNVNFKLKVLPPGLHLVDRYFNAAKTLGVVDDQRGLDFHIQEAVSGLPQSQYVTIALGAAHMTKMIPFEKLQEICEHISQETILLGGPNEKDLGESLATQFAHVRNFAGKCSIHQSAYIIERSSLLITPDTGMMHIAAALKKPMAVLWGNTIPDFGMYPYYGNEKVSHYFGEVSLKCRPCSKIGHDKCPKGHFDCMRKQDVPALLEWVTMTLESTNKS